MRYLGWCGGVVVVLLIAALAYTSKEAQSLPEVKWNFAYDTAGRITRLVDPAGQATTLQYTLDDVGQVRQVTRTLPDGSHVHIELDERGRRVRMTDSSGTVRYDYDGFDRLVAVRRDGSPAVVYAYDTLGRLSAITLDDVRTMQYTYDFLGRLASMQTSAGNITYDYRARLTVRTLPNGIRTMMESNPDGSLKTLRHVAPDNTLLVQYTYAYRPDGRIREIKEISPHGEKLVTYAYDTAQRLVSVGDPQHGEFRYAYDQFGNRTASTVSGQQTMDSAFDWAGRMTRYAGQASASDAAGNITAYTGAWGTWSFTYTSAHTLEAVHTEQGQVVAYRWDGDGQLIARGSGATQTTFVSDALSAGAWRPLATVHADGTREFYVWEEGVPLAVVTHGEVQFFLYDHQSVRLVTDRRGAVVQRYDYTPLGTLHMIRGQERAEDKMRPAFAGWFLDPYASLYLTRAGAYDPRLGRLLQQGRQVYATMLHTASPGLDRAGEALTGGEGPQVPGKSPSP